MKRALVTRGAGSIGSNLVDALMEQGHQVRVVDNLTSGTSDNLKRWLSNPRFSFENNDLLSRYRQGTDP